MPRRLRRPVVLLMLSRRKAALALALLVTAGSVTTALATVATPRSPSGRTVLTGRVIGIDPGHGEIDSGATHPESPLAEKEIVLDVGLRLARLVRKAGGRAVLTRTEDKESDLPDREELQRRADLARAGGAELFLSLHVDANGDSSAFGGQVYYHPSSAEGRRLAELLQAELVRLQPENFRRSAPQNFYLLTCIRVPAVVVELGFISNPGDRRNLNDPAYREKLAEALRRGLETYLATSGATPPLGKGDEPRRDGSAEARPGAENRQGLARPGTR
ncbi:MAG: N-acetylmuramoyl-L-alanine amidase family protein [Chitinophagales bacterium]